MTARRPPETSAPFDSDTVEALKPRAAAWFAELRDRICAAFERIEVEATGPFHPAMEKLEAQLSAFLG